MTPAAPSADEAPAPSGASTADGHVASLDGLRALAIVLVLVNHFAARMPEGVPLVVRRTIASGWCGVDLFFALSGFLITGILLRSRARPHFWRSFYVRRALRILPLYYGLTTLVLVARAAAGRADPSEAPAWIQYTFLYNYWAAHRPVGAEVQTLDVSWSLCVEEHFYVVWPFIVRFLPVRVLGVVLAVVVAAACALRWWSFAGASFAPTYVQTHCRMDALAVGAAAAVAWHTRAMAWIRAARVVAPWLCALACALVVLGAFDRARLAFVVFGYLLVPTATAAAILALLSGAWPGASAALSRAPVVGVGRVSYGLYLLHPPIATAVIGASMQWGVGPTTSVAALVGVTVVGCALSIAVATLTWRAVEAPMLRLKDRLAPRTRAL